MEYLLQILVTLVVLYALARLGSAIISRFGLPGLIGEILIGVIVANLVIGDFNLMEDFLNMTMPEPGDAEDHGSGVYPIVYALAELGVIFLLFMVGLETKVSDLLKSGKAAFFCALFGVIVPFVMGFVLIMATDGNTNHALFLGAAMVATSVGITARIIKDLNLMETREARIIIAAAVIDDVLGMIVLAIVKGMAQSDGFSILGVVSITLQAVVFVLAIIAVCKWVIPPLYDRIAARRAASGGKNRMAVNMFAVSIIVCLAMSAFAEVIGLAAIIGAFLAGMMFADHASEWGLEEKVDSITTFLLSFFFLNVGLQVDISAIGGTSVLILAIVTIVLAVISKLIGCSLGAKFGDRSLDGQSMKIIGFGMAPRGEVGIIVASIGLGLGTEIMSQELYAVVVLMSVVTTIIAPPLISKLFKAKYGNEEYRILEGQS